MSITFVAVPSEQARVASRDMMARNMTNYALLFGGDRWRHVTHVVIARDEDGALIGLASLAMQGEDGQGTPEIVGVWVAPAQRRQGLGIRLLTRSQTRRLIHTAREPVRISGVTHAVHALARRAQEQGLRLEVRSSQGFGELP